jgi:hypothetical protein
MSNFNGYAAYGPPMWLTAIEPWKQFVPDAGHMIHYSAAYAILKTTEIKQMEAA